MCEVESHIFISEHFVHIVYSILKIIYVLYMRFESHLFHFCLSPVAFNTTERQRWAKEKKLIFFFSFEKRRKSVNKWREGGNPNIRKKKKKEPAPETAHQMWSGGVQGTRASAKGPQKKGPKKMGPKKKLPKSVCPCYM